MDIKKIKIKAIQNNTVLSAIEKNKEIHEYTDLVTAYKIYIENLNNDSDIIFWMKLVLIIIRLKNLVGHLKDMGLSN